MKTLCVKVQNDYLERMSKVQKPIMALEELIWNGLDADASRVRVRIHESRLGGLERITVSDNGHGLDYASATPAFENLGGSWKRTAQRTKDRRRLLHGQAGKGRFRAFALGTVVTWTTRFSDTGTVQEYQIVGQRESLGTFTISDPGVAHSQRTGTDVEIQAGGKDFRSLIGPRAIQEVTERFAFYLREYPEIRIIYDGTTIDPATIEDHVENYTLDPITLDDGRIAEAKLTVIEWKVATERALYLCDADGFALGSISPGIPAPGFNFTAYLKSAFLRELDEQNSLLLEDLHPDLKKLLEPAKQKLREHFRRRTAEGAVDLVEAWKREKIYPFPSEPQGEARRIRAATRTDFPHGYY